jgi:heme A synthase
MRHTQSGLAVPDFPLAYGQLFPKLDPTSVAGYNEARTWDYHLPQVTALQIMYHMSHRLGAVIVTLSVLLTSIMTIRRHSTTAIIRMPAVTLLVLLGLQWVLGAMTVLTGRAPIIATLHVAVGAATLATSVVLAVRARRFLVTVERNELLPLSVVGAAA